MTPYDALSGSELLHITFYFQKYGCYRPTKDLDHGGLKISILLVSGRSFLTSSLMLHVWWDQFPKIVIKLTDSGNKCLGSMLKSYEIFFKSNHCFKMTPRFTEELAKKVMKLSNNVYLSKLFYITVGLLYNLHAPLNTFMIQYLIHCIYNTVYSLSLIHI